MSNVEDCASRSSTNEISDISHPRTLTVHQFELMKLQSVEDPFTVYDQAVVIPKLRSALDQEVVDTTIMICNHVEQGTSLAIAQKKHMLDQSNDFRVGPATGIGTNFVAPFLEVSIICSLCE